MLHVYTTIYDIGPVMSCDWLCDGDQLVTASWDHSALLWDAHTGARIHTLSGQSLYMYIKGHM